MYYEGISNNSNGEAFVYNKVVGRFNVNATSGYEELLGIHVSEDGKYFHDTYKDNDGATVYPYFTEQETAEANELLNTLVPNKVLLESPYANNDENINLYLPIDENIIRENILNSSDLDVNCIISKDDENINIFADKNILPDNVTFSSSVVASGSTYDNVVQLVTNLPVASLNNTIYDLSILDSSNSAIHQLGKEICVALPLPENMKEDNQIQVYRLEDDNVTLTPCITGTRHGLITFYTDHFSIFVITETQKEANSGNDADNNNNNDNNSNDNNDNKVEATPVVVNTEAKSPKTGQDFNLILSLAFIAISMTSISSLLYKKIK